MESGFVLIVENGLHFAQEHLFTIKPEPAGIQKLLKFSKPDPVGTFKFFKPDPKYGIYTKEINNRQR